MKEKMVCYIDSYDLITVLIDKSIYNSKKSFSLVDGDELIELDIMGDYDESQFHKYLVKFNPSIKLNKDYYIVDEKFHKGKLYSGSIVRTNEFEERYKYDGPLGFEYYTDHTTFRVWSPVAKEMYIELIHGEEKERYDMFYAEKGLWITTVNKDIEGYGYRIFVRVFDKFEASLDPYAISSTANHKYNYVIDKNKLYKMKYNKPVFDGSYTDSIIYEVSIADFTYNLESENKGTYLGLLENNKTKKGDTGIDYIKSLGVSHVQLLPTFDFGGVDDLKKTSKYNWGYNPIQYFVPSGWYSKNPSDPYSRINELKELIDVIHSKGMRVNMDVVFNHVFNNNDFPFDKLVPGYYYRFDSNGSLSNASGCGNVIATEKYMASRFVIDVLKYYVNEFNVSGFRFDLMGLLDVDTLNNANEELRRIDNTIMLYGEGWNMSNPLPNEKRPHMYNHNKVPNYAFFNDRFRDNIRGSQWNRNSGYAYDNNKSIFDLNHLITGSCLDYYKFNEPSQSLNYVECHDNYTNYDYGKYCLGLEDKEIFDACRLSMSLVILSQGIPFIHAGEEFFRTKGGTENSYKSKYAVNKFDYKRRDKYINNVNTLRDLISIREDYKEFRFNTRGKIDRYVHVLDGMLNDKCTGLLMEGNGYQLFLIVKNDYETQFLEFENTAMIFDGFRRCDIRGIVFKIDKPGVYVLRKDKKNADNWQNFWY